jgi:hypothetical protein
MQGPDPVLFAEAQHPEQPGATPPEALACYDVACLRTLGAILYVEADSLAFSESFETAALDSAEVYKHVCSTVVLRDETKTFSLVKPLYSTCSHDELPLKNVDRVVHTGIAR